MRGLTARQLSWIRDTHPEESGTIDSLPDEVIRELYCDVLSYGPNFQEVLTVAEKMRALEAPDIASAYYHLVTLRPVSSVKVALSQEITQAPDSVETDIVEVLIGVHRLASSVHNHIKSQGCNFLDVVVILNAVAGQNLYDWNPYTYVHSADNVNWPTLLNDRMAKKFAHAAKMMNQFDPEKFVLYQEALRVLL